MNELAEAAACQTTQPTSGHCPIDEAAAGRLLSLLEDTGYHFVTVTPESHRRVLQRTTMRQAGDLRGVFGWSLPFDEAALPPAMLQLLHDAHLLKAAELPGGSLGWKSLARVSSVCGRLYLHSAFPTTSDDSVFLGPDTSRFCLFINRELDKRDDVRRVVDIGAGAGVGGITAGARLPGAAIELVDINERALAHARVNAAHAGVAVRTYYSDGVADVEPGFDLAIANPPFIIDDDGPTYRAGGGMHGAELSLQWALDATRKLAPGGRVLLYTGSAIVDGRDALRDALERELGTMGAEMAYTELDPDIFGEELSKPAYADVDRIAAIGAVIAKPS